MALCAVLLRFDPRRRIRWFAGVCSCQHGRCWWLQRVAMVCQATLRTMEVTNQRTRIFIIEGIITTLVGIAGKWTVADWPETAKFLNDEERALLVARLAADAGEAKMNRLDRAATKRVFGDWKIYCGILMYIGVTNTGYATSVRNGR